MADSDVLGILSLLLAAGGAAYLIRVRMVSRKATLEASQQMYSLPPSGTDSRAPSADGVPSSEPDSGRRRDTIPPRLRDISTREQLQQREPRVDVPLAKATLQSAPDDPVKVKPIAKWESKGTVEEPKSTKDKDKDTKDGATPSKAPETKPSANASNEKKAQLRKGMPSQAKNTIVGSSAVITALTPTKEDAAPPISGATAKAEPAAATPPATTSPAAAAAKPAPVSAPVSAPTSAPVPAPPISSTKDVSQIANATAKAAAAGGAPAKTPAAPPSSQKNVAVRAKDPAPKDAKERDAKDAKEKDAKEKDKKAAPVAAVPAKPATTSSTATPAVAAKPKAGGGPTPTPTPAAPIAAPPGAVVVGMPGKAIVGGAAAASAASASPPPPTAKAKPKPSEPEIPRIEVEEDEDLEPTKVGKAVRRAIQPIVEKVIFDEGAEKEPAKDPNAKPLKLLVYALAQSDPGKRRKQNEDSFLVADKHGLYVVADGMGGHRGGQYASKLAVHTMSDAFESRAFEADAHPGIPLEASELARAIQMSNAAIMEEAARKPDLKGMGTTICAARFVHDTQRLYLGHVGDSRCYRVRGGVMKQMTTDHTMADYGVAGPEGAHLSRALGVWPTVPVDIVYAAPELGDLYLLCSDGLTKMLPDGTIATQLLHEDDPRAAVERLVFFANAHGGKDNITVILLKVVEADWKPPASKRQSRPDY